MLPACWIPEATNTISEFVICIATIVFPKAPQCYIIVHCHTCLYCYCISNTIVCVRWFELHRRNWDICPVIFRHNYTVDVRAKLWCPLFILEDFYWNRRYLLVSTHFIVIQNYILVSGHISCWQQQACLSISVRLFFRDRFEHCTGNSLSGLESFLGSRQILN